MSRRAFRLGKLHRRIDEEIRMEQRNKFINPFRISRLKKIKLALRDRLAALARVPNKA